MAGFTIIEFLPFSRFLTSFFGPLHTKIRGIIDVIIFAAGFSGRMLNLNPLILTRFAANFSCHLHTKVRGMIFLPPA